MPILDTTQWGAAEDTSQTPEPSRPAPKTGFIDGVQATWQQESIWVPSKVRSVTEYPNDSSFDFKTYDQEYWPLVAEARNREHADDMIAQYNQERENKKIMDNQGFLLGIGTNLVVGLTNPLNYIGVGKAASISGAAARFGAGAAAGTAATEALLHERQLTRTAEDSLYNIAGSAVIGGALGAASKAVGNRIARGAFGANEPVGVPDLPLNPIADATGFGADSISAARARPRDMSDSKLASIPFLPASWTEPIARFGLLGKFSRSANQRLQTSSFSTVRNAHHVLVRTGLSTNENAAGVSNQVPVEVAVGQRAGSMLTALKETDYNLREAWWKKVEGGTYDRQAIADALKAQDPSLGDNYEVNRNSFDRLLKLFMADDKSLGSQMQEVVQRVERAAEQRAALDADKIDLGLARKQDLVDIATGQRLGHPDESIQVAQLKALREGRAEVQAELDALKSSRNKRTPLTAEEKATRASLQQKLAGHDQAIADKMVEVDQLRADWDNIIPSSKTHRFAYEDGSHYLHRVFDKGRIVGNRNGFIDALIQGWAARNPDIDLQDQITMLDLRLAADKVVAKLLNEEDLGTLGDLLANLDLPGKYTKGRTLNVDDRFLVNWTHDDVTATEAFHITQATVDVEMARNGVKFNELLESIQSELNVRIAAANEEYGVGTRKAQNAIAKLQSEAKQDMAELEYVMRRLKRQAPPGSNKDSLNDWLNRANRVAGMSQLGSSALPNSIGDVASVARSLGSGNTYKIIAKSFSPEVFKDMRLHAKQLGVLSDLVDTNVREANISDMLTESMNPNKRFRSTALQTLDHGLDRAGKLYTKYSLIDGWSRVGRTVASTASVQHILESANKGWHSLHLTTRTDLARFYIDEDMLGRIQAQAAKYADNKDGVYFAGVEKWDDAEAARVFNASVYAHTEHALNIPSIGTGSQFMTETFFGRMLMRFKSFNNAAHENAFLSSLQNREYSRVITGALNYAWWGFVSVWAYDTLTGRPNDFEHYFGDAEAMQKTAWKTLAKGGYVAAASDAFITASKALGHEYTGAIGEAWRGIMPEQVEKELFPRYDDLSATEKALGPTFGYILSTGKTIGGFLDGDVTEYDIHGLRTALPGQNIGWLRRPLDYIEEFLGGLPADRHQNR